MKMNKPDRRTEKTRQSIYNALIDLMQEKKYSNITIQEIIDRANVGRSTFYSHFDTKDELLKSCIENVFELLNDHFIKYIEETGNQTRFVPIAELLAHIMANSRKIRGIMSTESADLVFDKFRSYWNIKIEKYLEGRLPKNKEPRVPLAILTNHITSTMIELFKWWLNHNTPYTPQQMDQYFQELIYPLLGEF
jgi:AcrR family transcriptional regulator